MNKLIHKLICINFHKNNQSIISTKKSISLPKRQFLKISSSVSCNKSCNNKDSNNKIFYNIKDQKIDNNILLINSSSKLIIN